MNLSAMLTRLIPFRALMVPLQARDAPRSPPYIVFQRILDGDAHLVARGAAIVCLTHTASITQCYRTASEVGAGPGKESSPERVTRIVSSRVNHSYIVCNRNSNGTKTRKAKETRLGLGTS